MFFGSASNDRARRMSNKSDRACNKFCCSIPGYTISPYDMSSDPTKGGVFDDGGARGTLVQ